MQNDEDLSIDNEEEEDLISRYETFFNISYITLKFLCYVGSWFEYNC